MKKKILTLITVTILVLSLTSCDVEVGSRARHYGAKYDASLDKEESIAIDNIKKIVIDTNFSEVNVYSTEGDNIQLSVKNSTTASGEVLMNKSGDSLDIKEVGEAKLSWNSNQSRNIDIAIPKSFNGNLELDYGVGEVSIKDIICDTLDIDGGAGQLYLKDVVFNELNLDSGTGTVDINLSKKCGNIDINGGVGEANFKIPEDAPVDIRTSSGIGSCDISAKTSGEKTYIFDLENGVGEIKVTN